jgi:hypothetical protein
VRAAAVVVLVAGIAAAISQRGDGGPERAVAAPVADRMIAGNAPSMTLPTLPPQTTTTTTAPPTTTTTAPPTTTTTAPPPPSPEQVAAAAKLTGLVPYTGLGTWVDVYDWSALKNNGNPPFGPADIDRIASLGVQTLYLQAAHNDSPEDVLEPDRQLPLIKRAHARGLRVVAWYLPMLEDPQADLRRMLTIAKLPVDGLAVDIESRSVDDVAERNRRLIWLSHQVRAALPGKVLGGIVLPPVIMEDVNPNYWPGYPWGDLAADYDVWLPMAYWTDRTAASGWRDGYRYIAENIDRIRARIGRPDAPVHAVGGIGDATTPADIDGMLRAAAERHVIGGSLYDYRTTGDPLWPKLQPFRGNDRR